MTRNQGDLPRVELLFNLGDSALNGDDGLALEADRAVVLRYPDAEAQWPLDALNDALGVIYAESNDIPCLYPVHGNGRVIGYLAMARDDALTEADLSQRFWEILAYNQCAAQTADGYRLRQEIPTPIGVWACWDDASTQPIAVVAYEARYGADLPLREVNDAVWSLHEQANWPGGEIGRLFLYPVRRGSSTLMSGILVAPLMDDLGDNDLIDDSMVHEVVQRNTDPKIYRGYPSQLQPRSYA